MKREKFKIIALRLRSVYSKDFMPDQTSFDTWYMLLRDLPDELVEIAATKYMMSNHYPPAPADIRSIAVEIAMQEKEDITEDDAVVILKRAVSRSSYYAEEEFAKLPEIIQRVAVSPAQLREMGLMDMEKFQSVEVSHFRRSFRASKERMKQETALSLEVREQIKRIREETEINKMETSIIRGGDVDGELQS